MVNQVFDLDGRLIRRHVRQVLADIILQRDSSFLRQQGNARRRELFGDGGDVEGGTRRDGPAGVHVGDAVRALELDLAVLDDQDSAAGAVGFDGLQNQLVDRIPPRVGSASLGSKGVKNHSTKQRNPGSRQTSDGGIHGFRVCA